jgi:hypothetical protein
MKLQSVSPCAVTISARPKLVDFQAQSVVSLTTGLRLSAGSHFVVSDFGPEGVMSRSLPMMVMSAVFAVLGAASAALFFNFRGQSGMSALAVIATTAFVLAASMLAAGIHSLAKEPKASRFIKALETIRRYVANDTLRDRQGD